MKKFFKFVWKFLLCVIALVFVAVLGVFAYLALTEYMPEPVEDTEVVNASGEPAMQIGSGDTLTITTQNTGYGSLGKEEDFFMDGGTGVMPNEREYVERNIGAIADTLIGLDSDIYLLQEVDIDSTRSYKVNERAYYADRLEGAYAEADNYVCGFVPYPWPMIGKVHSGLQTVSKLSTENAQRISLDSQMNWPMRLAYLKRCLLVTRTPLSGTDAELVIVNLHLEAYDSGEQKAAQTKQLISLLSAEYEKGNYVIAGGDFNQTFEDVRGLYPQKEGLWTPGVLSNADLPEGFAYVTGDTATCRLLDAPYDANTTQHYVIDGFIISPNVELLDVFVTETGFEYTDHQPVTVTVRLK